MKKNLGLVHSCANRFRGRFIEYDDLFSAGCVGLLKAIDGFDENRGIMFSTYAVPAILGEMKRLFRDGGALKVSRSLKDLSMKTIRERERYMKEFSREPTLSELAEILEVSMETVVEALNVSIPPMSLTLQDEDGESQLDVPIDVIDDRIADTISLNEVINTLDSQDKQLILLRYYQNKTQSETAAVLGMTQVQVSRREKKLLQKLRIKLSG
ncbi:sigma-70 family RNA polymerase sigma factor [Paludicola sp. MB14-C6]|uniref:sigma-70 family RNA polymerase sigma factor n=1 Tax=Paludihabitans sp. MB14-C6 TaxID=3070656 RepID=UPI0027DBF0F7|nr:sigma-70 family RNA polymerase sigma factor [Paludicola sp. MB14-C6]WMJ23992.1 sigma-70 family RNA polymerase sigma factor [Paludicola sp. MB14-C6]